MLMLVVLHFLINFILLTAAYNYSFINLPPEHLEAYFANHKDINEICNEDPDCPYKQYLKSDSCWGYEYGCLKINRKTKPICTGDHKGWVKTKGNQEDTFFTQADFGFVKQQIDETQVICEALFLDDSSLECSNHLRFCRGRNILINFTDLASREEPIRYKMDVLKKGQIGGYCKLYEERLHENTDHLSPLQSWAPEMRFFTEMPQRPIQENLCDVVIEKPTFIMKIDATVNMYHHFCDFLNLYASQHLNWTGMEAFNQDINILIWETFTYRSAFAEAFEAFTKNPIWDLKTFRGETVCFKNVMFPLLPRMIFGLYYNTPIIYGCENSGLFRAFSEHFLYRLGIPLQPKRNSRSIRITLLSRDTKYRRALNEAELLEELEKEAESEDWHIRRVVFNRQTPFKEQLAIVRNTDVFIGMHGAGLTHLLFLPDWAVLFELYNCEDPNCYMDLTRLRGLKYLTWQRMDLLEQQDQGHHPEGGGAHAKFTNYSFDTDEFLRLVRQATRHVEDHPQFVAQFGGPESNVGTIVPLEYDESIEMDSDFSKITREKQIGKTTKLEEASLPKRDEL